MKKIIPIYGGKEFTINKLIYPEKDITSFVYTHDTRFESIFIAILPYRIVEDHLQYLLKNDMIYCWDDGKTVLIPIQYGFESQKFESMEVSVRNKIFDELGYTINIDDIINLGTTFNNISSDTQYYLYSIDLTDKEKKATSSTCIWCDSVEGADDAISYTLHYKLLNYLKQIN